MITAGDNFTQPFISQNSKTLNIFFVTNLNNFFFLNFQIEFSIIFQQTWYKGEMLYRMAMFKYFSHKIKSVSQPAYSLFIHIGSFLYFKLLCCFIVAVVTVLDSKIKTGKL